MAAKSVVVGGAIAVDGMAESLSGLRRVRSDLPKIITKVSRETAKNPVAAKARANWSRQRINPGKANRAITASGTTQGAAINLRASAVPTAAAVEFGTHIHFVYGRPTPARSMKRRVFPPWKGNAFTVAPGGSVGYVVQEAIRDTLPIVEKRWLNEVLEAIERAVKDG